MYRALLIVFAIASTMTLQGCASMDLHSAVNIHNTARAMGTLTAGGVAAEFVQQQGWRDAR
jgi:outer membrane lipoprotein SlyB